MHDGGSRTPSAHSPCRGQRRCRRRGTLAPYSAHSGSWRAPAEGTRSGCRLLPFGRSLYWQRSTSGSSGSERAARPLRLLSGVIELVQLQLVALTESCLWHRPMGCKWSRPTKLGASRQKSGAIRIRGQLRLPYFTDIKKHDASKDPVHCRHGSA